MKNYGIHPDAAIKVLEVLQKFGIEDNEKISNFYKSFDQLDWDTQSIFATVVSNMYYCSVNDYIPSLENSLRHLGAHLRDLGVSNIIVVPSVRESENEVKSGDFVSYFLKSNRLVEKAVEGIPVHHRKPPLIQDEFEGSAVLLVDDYIGSGDTVSKIIANEFGGWCKSQIVVCSIACHMIGFEKLDSQGIAVFSSVLRDRSVSDYNGGDFDVSVAIERLEWFATQFGVGKKYTYGYGGCQSNDVLARVPNNCLPFFWHNREPCEQGYFWKPLFARH